MSVDGSIGPTTSDELRRIIAEELRLAMVPAMQTVALDPSVVNLWDQPLTQWVYAPDTATTWTTTTVTTTDNDDFRLTLPAPGGGPPPKQSLDLPDDLEIIDECQIAEWNEGQKTLEFWISGPTLPADLEVTEEMFKRLDFELKMALVRAFRLTPPTQRKRTVIVDERDD